MTKHELFNSLDNAKPARGPVHLAIGMFDGVHLGHKAVIGAAIEFARRDGGSAGVLTFFPHPSRLFTPSRATELILTPEVKRWLLLDRLGANFMIEEPFTAEFAAIPAGDFVSHLSARIPNLAGIYVGENWRFGHGRGGDAALLKTLCESHGIRLFSAPRVSTGGSPISSTRIRVLIATGGIEQANTLLGYDYTSFGTVVAGRRLGRTIGFPTLNMPWEPECRPALGVYEVRVSSAAGDERLPAVANYGLRPTIGDRQAPLLEAHLLVSSGLGEGDRLRVEWCRFERAEARFPSVEALRVQIVADRASAAAYFGLE
ncbi:MAG TPA: riboflavin biosynthesis protein RibF [Opitutaceae bacterium]|nr:riboflavin biosynthesis protein RibF [Opitutaceae bacterium]